MEDYHSEGTSTLVCGERLIGNGDASTSVQVCHVPSLKQVTLTLSCSVSFPSLQDLAVFSDTEILCVRWGPSQMYQDRSLELLCEWLQRLPRLRKLELDNYRIHGHHRLFLTLANYCGELESLSLQTAGAHMGRIRVIEERQAWEKMLRLPYLNELFLFGINFATGDIFDSLAQTSLQVFTFWRCRIGRESGNLTKVLARCEKLKTLQLHCLDRQQIQATLPPNLESLHLSLVAISRETCQSIQNHDNLRQIRFTGCSFFDHPLPFNPKWESYGLYHTNLDVLPAFHNASLHTLEMVDCNLSDEKLDISLIPSSLKCFNLSHNPGFSTAFLSALLSKCDSLECLHLSGMPVDIAGVCAAVAVHYSLNDIVIDSEIPGNVQTYLRLNQAGRRYLQNDQICPSMSANVLGEVSCHLNDIYTHLLESPSICSLPGR